MQSQLASNLQPSHLSIPSEEMLGMSPSKSQSWGFFSLGFAVSLTQWTDRTMTTNDPAF